MSERTRLSSRIVYSQTNSWMQADFHSVTLRGLLHGFGVWGGAKRAGGDRAKGIPRNLLTAAVAEGKVVCVPTSSPEARVTVGACVSWLAVGAKAAVEVTPKIEIKSSSAEAIEIKPEAASQF